MMIDIDNSFTELTQEISEGAKKIVDEKKSFSELKDLAEFYGRRGWRSGSVKDLKKMLEYALALIHKAKNTED